MLRDIIRAHLAYKSGPYDKETILSKTATAEIRKMVDERLREKVQEWRSQIEAVVDRTLGPSARDAVATALDAALRRVTLSNLAIHISLNESDDD
jgi:vacuolar-type H+-ATPase subunit E/Vma4